MATCNRELFQIMWTINTLFVFGLVCVLQATLVTGACTAGGRRFQVGDAWADSESCDACECQPDYGVTCYARLDDGKCKLNRTMVAPYDPLCRYSTKSYLVGQAFNAVDGCNACACTANGMNCTIKSCDVNGFATPSKAPLYGECLYDGLWYPFHSQWMSRDHCNTCYCYSIGNYRGGHICTKNKCSTHIVDIAG